MALRSESLSKLPEADDAEAIESAGQPLWQSWVLLSLVSLLTSLLGGALLAQHRAFNSNGWDLAWFDQIVWNSSQGRLFENSFAPWSFLGEHVEPILLFFALIYKVKAEVEILLLVQVVVAVLAAVPLYFAARAVLQSATAGLLVATAFLVAPQFHGAVLFDFHPEVMGLASIFAAFACLAARRPDWALVAIASAFLFKEDASLVALGIAWVFWLYGYRRRAVGLAGVSLVYFVLVTNIIMPYARGGDGGPQARWDYLGDTGSEIVLNAVLHPDRVVNHLSLPEPRAAIATLLSTQALLPLATPASLAIVPITLAHLLSTHEAEMKLTLHYGALPLGLAFVASTLGIKTLAHSSLADRVWQRLRVARQQRVVVLAGGLLAAQLVAAVLSGPFGLKFDLSHYTRPDDHSLAVREVLRFVPPRASVAAQSGLVPHLSQRREIWEFPPAFGAQYVVLDLASWHTYHGPTTPERDYEMARIALPSTGYCLIVERASVQLWRLCEQETGPQPGDAPAGSVQRDAAS